MIATLPPASYCWVTPPAPAAIAVCALRWPPGVDPASLLDVWPRPGRARFGHLRDDDGTVIDEVVVMAEADDALLLCCHGGPGVRRLVSARLAACGLQAEAAPADDDLWGRLARVASPAARDWVLAHGLAEPPFAAELLYRPVMVLIAGPANAGKSTLLNTWCGHARAQVADQPGTTRDLVTVDLSHRGWALRLIDSAGWRITDDTLEQAGQALVQQAAASADVVLWLAPEDDPGSSLPAVLPVRAKADQAPTADGLSWSAPPFSDPATVAARLTALGDAIMGRCCLP